MASIELRPADIVAFTLTLAVLLMFVAMAISTIKKPNKSEYLTQSIEKIMLAILGGLIGYIGGRSE